MTFFLINYKGVRACQKVLWSHLTKNKLKRCRAYNPITPLKKKYIYKTELNISLKT